MKNTFSSETEEIVSSAETESIVASTVNKVSDHEIENSASSSVTSKEVAHPIKAVTGPSTRQLKPLCELM